MIFQIQFRINVFIAFYSEVKFMDCILYFFFFIFGALYHIQLCSGLTAHCDQGSLLAGSGLCIVWGIEPRSTASAVPTVLLLQSSIIYFYS